MKVWSRLLLMGLTLQWSVLPADAASVRISLLVIEGDTVPGVGIVTRIDELGVSNDGDWTVEADTDNADTERDSVVLRNGALYVREGDALPLPAGASIGSFDSININANGNSGWNLFLDGTSGTSDDSGVYLNTDLVIQEGDVSTSPDFSAGTPYIGFFDVKINNSDELFIVASIDDPAIPSTVDRALMRVTAAPLTETVIAKETDILPGQTEMVADFGTGPHASAFNDNGEAMYIADLTGDTAVDIAVYIDDTLIAQEGAASPIAGRNWLTIGTSARLDLNNDGGYVHTGTLDGDAATNAVIVSHRGKVAQEGDSPADIGGFLLTGFGTAPVQIDDGGNVLWFGDWDDPDTTRDTGLFRNQKLILQEGVSMAGIFLVSTVNSGESAFDLSNNGKYLIAEVSLFDGATFNGAILLAICAEDIDGDGSIGFNDLVALLGAYGSCDGDPLYDPEADLDNDGCVGFSDLVTLLGAYGSPCP